MITISAFHWVPPFAQGLVRDLRVRWALEEAGAHYNVRLLADGEKNSPEYRALQPFGQVPIYEEDGLVLFESGAILQHIAEKSEALMPRDAASRARVITWMYSALNSIGPSVLNVTTIDLFNDDQDWARTRRPAELAKVETRFAALNEWLGQQDHLEAGRFTGADGYPPAGGGDGAGDLGAVERLYRWTIRRSDENKTYMRSDRARLHRASATHD